MSLAVVSASQSYDVFDLQFNRSVLRAARHMYRSSYLPHLEPEGLVQAQELHLQRPRHKWEPCDGTASFGSIVFVSSFCTIATRRGQKR